MNATAQPARMSASNIGASSFFIWLCQTPNDERRTPEPSRVSIQVVLQDDRGSSRVEPGLPLPPVTLADCQAAFGFAAREPLVFRRNRERRTHFQRGDECADARRLRRRSAI